MDRKGISPLVASVLLIAFTLSIAGIMATWSTSFVRGKTSVITSQAECIGSLDVEVKNYQSGVDGSGNAVANVTLMIRNPKSTISLSDILISLEFPTSPFNQTETVKGNHEEC
ncbi:MAG: hypothetical protein HZB67_03095 [Candidatus Aenigmarchaeota archaeon]|nr:hypothetical protein [Candidatus Aenigmarchaeota archaeon]